MKYLLLLPMAFVYMAMRMSERGAKTFGKWNDWYLDKYFRPLKTPPQETNDKLNH